jgi:hypothetical protein
MLTTFQHPLLEQNIGNVIGRSREKQKDTTGDKSGVINDASKWKPIKQANGISDKPPKKDKVIYNVIRAGILYHRMMSRIGAPQQNTLKFPKSIVKFFAETTTKWINDATNRVGTVTARKINEAFDDLKFLYEEKENEEEKISQYIRRIEKESQIDKKWLIELLEFMTKGEDEPNEDILSFGSSKYRLNNNIKFSKTEFQRGIEIIAKWREWINVSEMEGQRELHIRSVLSNISEFIDELKFSKKVIDTNGEITEPNNEIIVRLIPKSLTFKKIFDIFIVQFWTPNIALTRIPGKSTIKYIIANKNHPDVYQDELDFVADILRFEEDISNSKRELETKEIARKIRNKLFRKKTQEWMDIEIKRICTACKKCSKKIVIANNKQTGRYELPVECELSPSFIAKNISVNSFSLVVGDKAMACGLPTKNKTPKETVERPEKNLVGRIVVEDYINLYEAIRKMVKRTE